MPGRAIIIHELAHARAALATARALAMPVTLLSAPLGAAGGGAGWFQAVVRQAMADHPQVPVAAILDCGDRAELALAALRQGLLHVGFRGDDETARRLADIAAQQGATLHRALPPALDLFGVADGAAACRAWLAGDAGGGEPNRLPGS